jgi:hypothetical protein
MMGENNMSYAESKKVEMSKELGIEFFEGEE